MVLVDFGDIPHGEASSRLITRQSFPFEQSEDRHLCLKLLLGQLPLGGEGRVEIRSKQRRQCASNSSCLGVCVCVCVL